MFLNYSDKSSCFWFFNNNSSENHNMQMIYITAVNITQLEATTDSDIAAATNNMTVHNASDILELVSPAQEYWE